MVFSGSLLLALWSTTPSLMQVEVDLSHLERQLALHASSLGDSEALRGEPLKLVGTLDASGRAFRVVVHVRREPFGYRREVTPLDGSGPSEVTVSNGRHAWRESADASFSFLAEADARICLEQAFLDGFLYLDPGTIRGLPQNPQSYTLPDHPGLPDPFERQVRTECLGLLTPAGTMQQFHFDVEDARLHEAVCVDLPPAPQWTRFGGWRRFGPFHLPALRAYGSVGANTVHLFRLESFETGVFLPPEAFSGFPAATTPRIQRAGSLRVAPDVIAGSAHVLLPEVHVNTVHVISAILDTGADRSGLEPSLAAVLRLSPRGPFAFEGMTSTFQSFGAWIDRLDVGDRPAFQTVVTCPMLPALGQLAADRQPAMVFGGDELFSDSPVLDLQNGEILFRGRPATALGELDARGAVVQVPLQRENSGWSVEIRVEGRPLRVLVDTGSAPVLRLGPRGLGKLGLPTRADDWLARGAAPVKIVGVGGKSSQSLVVSFDSLDLGPMHYLAPLVHLTGLFDEALPADGMLGFGAFLPFTRVGLCFERGELELECGDDLVRTESGEYEIPGSGPFLGLVLSSPPLAAVNGRLLFPAVLEVPPGTPAARAGIQAGNLLRSLDGISCAGREMCSINRRLWLRKGQSVTVEIIDAQSRVKTLRLSQEQ